MTNADSIHTSDGSERDEGARPSDLVEFVLPVYNEAHVLATSVERLMAAAAEWSDFSWRIWIVDNASVDGTSLEGERLAAASGGPGEVDRRGRSAHPAEPHRVPAQCARAFVVATKKVKIKN